MSIEIKCNCGSEYRLGDDRSGIIFICKVCRAELVVPKGSPRGVNRDEIPPVVIAHDGLTRSAEGAHQDQRPAPATSGMSKAFYNAGVAQAHAGQEEADDDKDGITHWPQAWSKGDLEKRDRPARPGRAWLIIRGVLWAASAAFLWAPWFVCPQSIDSSGPVGAMSLPGWKMVLSSADTAAATIADSRDGLAETFRRLTGLNELPADPNVAAGTALLMFAPALYGLGLVGVLFFAAAAIKRGSRGLVVPFSLCMVSLLALVIGWQLTSGAIPIWRAGPDAPSIGLSMWVYIMLMALVPMMLLMSTRPAPVEEETEERQVRTAASR